MSALFFSLILSSLVWMDIAVWPPISSSQVPAVSIGVVKEIPQRDYSKLSAGVEITASSSAVVDFDSGNYLYTKDIDNKLPIASITKLMTALVFLDNNPGWDELVTLDTADEVYRAKYVYRGEQVTIRDLFYLSLVGSDNNATHSLVRASGLTLDDFVLAMNDQANKLNMVSTVFVDPTGLSPQNISTVRDLVVLVSKVWRQPDILDATSLDEFYLSIKNTGVKRRVPSTNKLLDSFLTVEAGKTGFIDEAGYCLVSKIRDNGHSVITVVLGSKEENDRFNDSKALAWWAFNNYIWP